jgi:Tfp pilus assembly protein PilV
VGADPGVAPRARGWWHAAATRRRAAAPESGLSLVEICVTVAIMGLALTGLISAMGSTVKMSSLATGNARAESEARRLTEALRIAPDDATCRAANVAYNKSYYTCVANKLLALAPMPNDVTWTVTSVECGRFTGDPPQPTYDATDGCSGSPPDFHRVNVTVNATGGPAASVSFIKRQASS